MAYQTRRKNNNMDPTDVERMRLKKQKQKLRRKEKKAAKERAAEEAIDISDALRRVRMLWPELTNNAITTFRTEGNFGPMGDLSNDDWDELGRNLANCKQLQILKIGYMGMRDQKISSLFRGLTRSSSINEMNLISNGFSVDGLRSMVPFLQNSNKLMNLCLDGNNLKSEGFNLLCRALRDSPIEYLHCNRCDIESIEIDSDHIPNNLATLFLSSNRINSCRGLANLLQGRDSTLRFLNLNNNKIDDEGVAILVDALQSNKSLKYLDLKNNGEITMEGKILLLKLVNNISSIKATLNTNHTLHIICVGDDAEEIQQRIEYGARHTCNRTKVIHTQLHNMRRAELCRLQGIERSNATLYSELDPLCLPEVLALVGRSHGLAELHVAVKSSIAMLFSTVDRIKCLEQEMSYHEARVAKLRAEIATIKRAKGDVVEVGNDFRNKKRRV